MKTIFLTGFMGSGKSAAGTLVASMLNARCLDLDAMIEQRAGKTITDIFAQDGEEAFRRLEHTLLQSMPEEDCVVITGGGVPVRDANRSCMKSKGNIVFLKTSFDEIMKRLSASGEKEKRPVLREKTKEEVLELFTIREPYYRDCTAEVITDGKTPTQVAEDILRALRLK